jgi:uncharacterized protein (DUF433 family)
MSKQHYYAVRANPELSEAEVEQEIKLLPSLAQGAPPITTNPERLGGTAVIGLSRVPVTTLIDYVMAGDGLDEFLDDFPAVSREEALAALEKIKEALDEGWLATRIDY